MRDSIDLERLPGHCIRRLQQVAVAIFLQETEATGITPVQYAVLLTLTDAGRAVLAELTPLMLRAQDRMLEPLAAADREQFMRMLRTLVQANNDLSRAPLEG